MKKVSRLTTALGVFTLGLGLAGASMAVAAPGDAPDAPAPTTAVEKDTKVSMTIVKYSGAEVATGSQPTEANKPIEGITFTVTRIDPNGAAPTVGTAAWWEWAHKQKTTSLTEATKGNSFMLTTDSNGQACLSNEESKTTAESANPKVVAGTACTVDATNVKQGLYLVEETGTTATDGKTYRGALPFFITLPLANNDNTWDYNPVVQPKNQEFTSAKKLTDASADSVTYTIDTSIPTTNMKAENGKVYNDKLPFGIEDIYPTALTPKTTDVKVFAKGTGDKVDLVKDTDYKVVEIAESAADAGDEVWAGALNGKKSLGIYFTTAGAAKLADAVAADPTAKVYFQLPFTVTDASAKILNKYVVHDPGSNKQPATPEDPAGPDPDDGGTPGTNDSLQFINVKITKTDAKNGATKLEGAVFNFYKCVKDADGNLVAKGKAVPGWTAEGAYNSDTDKTYDFSTAASTGEVTAYHVLNTAKINTTDENGVPSTEKYVMCAVEKTAPSGYVANPYPIEITDAGSTAQDAEKPVTIPNTKATFWDQLPATGATGVTILLLVGGGMVIVGLLMRRRREEA